MVSYIILGIISSLFSNAYATIQTLMSHYGLLAVFGLLLLESSSIPVPSEVILPLAGIFVANGTLRFVPAYIAALLGSLAGIAIDYYIGYFLGKDVVYRHLRFFHVTQERLDAFDAWFARNGLAAVFLSRLVPVIRTIMSFPAGFARMEPKRFFGYSVAGAAIYDVVLLIFGMKALSTNNAVITLTAVGIFAIALYIVYKFALKHISK